MNETQAAMLAQIRADHAEYRDRVNFEFIEESEREIHEHRAFLLALVEEQETEIAMMKLFAVRAGQ